MPNKHTALYSVMFGLQGCYMPDSGPNLLPACDTRKALAEAIRYEIEHYGFPKSSLRQVKLRKLWAFIQAHGSSAAHFHVAHKHNAISFSGLTLDEVSEMEAANE